jgi:hypothetical protein
MESNHPIAPNGHAGLSEEAKAVEKAFRAAVREAFIEHKLRGLPIVGNDNGKVKWIPADEIVIPPAEPK